MSIDRPFPGGLFSGDYLGEAIRESDDWLAFGDASLYALEAGLNDIFSRFPLAGTPNESQTEDDLIWPVLELLGWTDWLRQQNLSFRGRGDVPDGLLFADAQAKAKANAVAEWQRYEHGLAIVESKRWARPLDRASAQTGEAIAPSTQMLRYLRRADDLTGGTLRWGILTNGQIWRLYWQGALSVSEQFFEIDLAAVMNLPSYNDDLFKLDAAARRHWLRVFALMFRREAFLPDPADGRTFHRRALDEGRYYQERVARNLSGVVFDKVFPDLARAIAAEKPDAPLPEVRDAALILLYRLLFILYAEDRDLLPVRNESYDDDYSVRIKVRDDVGPRKDKNDVFSEKAPLYWSVIDNLCRAIDGGDPSIGLPPYNGGLFDRQRTPLLSDIRLGDAVIADVIDALSFERTPQGRRYINYRELGVQQLGSIYERLLEREIVREEGKILVRPNLFARKDSGSYYTPDDLVGLIIGETVGPLVEARMKAFEAKARQLPEDGTEGGEAHERAVAELRNRDPAEQILELKVCDPAMGSGHFLVNLVDYLSDRVIAAMAESEALVEGYVSPLAGRIEAIRETILENAEAGGWTVDPVRLDDRHVVRRMVLKRCAYGVDKNAMAVELAKVALWLHTFTVGAPLSFLDHHLRCGDSLFGAWVRTGIDKAAQYGSPLLLHESVRGAERTAQAMQRIEGLTDAEIAEAQRSADTFAEVEEATAPLNSVLSLVHALDWLNVRDRDGTAAIQAFFAGALGDPIEIALGSAGIDTSHRDAALFAEILAQVRRLIAEEGFLHWQVAFPGVWSNWESAGLEGGFDAVIGNPPWDRMKLEPVEWFASRRPEIALAQHAAARRQMIGDLERASDPLAQEFAQASARASATVRIARKVGDYPLLSGGDVNLYSLFVERAMTLAKPAGMVGLLTPSGIASDKTAARFFKGVATGGRLKALYDFENKKVFFPDVHASFKFCIFVASPSKLSEPANCAFYIHNVAELDDPQRCFPLTAADFARVNPNTGTAPIFRSRRDAELTTTIYRRLPDVADRSLGEAVKTWPVNYSTMFHMANDSGLFRTRPELEEKEGAWPVGGNRFRNAGGEWLPLYVGRMIHQFDHRAASVEINPKNLHNPALSAEITPHRKADPNFSPVPQYWVAAEEVALPSGLPWTVAFRDIARVTDIRTMIASVIPFAGVGHTLPILSMADCEETSRADLASFITANLNSTIFLLIHDTPP